MEEAPNAATLVQAVRAHAGEVTCLDASGARLVTGGGDRALRLWTWRAGAGWQAAAEARAAHRFGVVAVRWARAGALLASAGVDGAVRVWSGRELAARRVLAAPAAAAARALCWAGGGAARLLAGHDDGVLCVWAPVRGELLARLQPHEGALHALAAPARDALLLTACTHGELKVFDLAEVCACGVSGVGPEPLQRVDGAHDLGALCADASEEGAAATGGQDGVVRVWCAAQGGRGLAPAATLEGHAAAVTAVRWARGVRGDVLASASLDRSARLWAAGAGACLLAVAAHPRYLTSVLLAPDLRYMITGSNDKSFRMWSLGAFTLDEELEPPCPALAHFALGDLEGIGPVEEQEGAEAERQGEAQSEGGSGARCVWSSLVHAGPINCIATRGELLATASSDGSVKVWQWSDATGEVVAAAAGRVGAGEYPALACDVGGAGGGVLLSAGLDGAAHLWDLQTGVLVRSLVVPGGSGGEAGGGGVRGARLSPHRAPFALLATDDGLAPLWRLTDPDPLPLRVYAGHAEAATSCAWSADGRAAATGAASGELRLYAPPHPRHLQHESHAHDLGVLSCDFAPPCSKISLPENWYLLATGGCDSLVKLWRVQVEADTEGWRGHMEEAACLCAHGGAVSVVRWGGGGLLASAGADRWARVWRVSADELGARAVQAAAVPVRGAGGAPAAALAASDALLCVGTLAGELAVWRLTPDEEGAPDDDGAAPRFWGETGVERWLRDYVLHAPGSRVTPSVAAAVLAHARSSAITGLRLLHDPIEELLDMFGFDEAGDDAGKVEDDPSSTADGTGPAEDDVCDVEDNASPAEDTASPAEGAAGLAEGAAGLAEGAAGLAEGAAGLAEGAAGLAECRSRARSELQWLRAAPPPPHVEGAAPHALLCPLSHRLLAEPACAADGYTYERANMAEWLAGAGTASAVSPVSGRRLCSAALAPNYSLRATLRAFLRDHAPAPLPPP